jgi:GNAT superfamily N-acetyltransferase
MSPDIPPAVAERSEADALADAEDSAPERARTELGMASLHLGGGVALSVRHDPTNFWSKALGFGFDEPVTADLVGEVSDFYRSQGTAMATVQLAPSVLPGDWADICAKHGLTAGSRWVKLACAAESALTGATEGTHALDADLRLAPVEPEHAAMWAATQLRVFEMPQGALAEMMAALVGRPGWYAYAVWAERRIVGVAAMRVRGEAAQFFGGATLPEYRRRGGQTALIMARARAAQDAGCRWLVAETGAEAPGTHNSSLHNLRRIGFEVVYERQNWTWRP